MKRGIWQKISWNVCWKCAEIGPSDSLLYLYPNYWNVQFSSGGGLRSPLLNARIFWNLFFTSRIILTVTRRSGILLLWMWFSIQYLHTFKRFQKDPSVIITLGIGHDTASEQKLLAVRIFVSLTCFENFFTNMQLLTLQYVSLGI